MAFFDEMKGKLTQATQTTAKKAKDLTDIAKLNGEISDAERKINDLYSKLGFEVYRLHQKDEAPEFADIIQQIRDLHTRIEENRRQIQTINGDSNCPNCGAKVKRGVAFCAACGTRVTVPAAPAAEQQPGVCPNCGAVLNPGSAFCGSCGTRVE